MKKYLTVICLPGLLFLQQGFSQQKISTDEAIVIIKNMKEQYMDTVGMRFNVKYSYANETKPSKLLDSLNGTFEMFQNNCHYILDSTETIKNDKYTIMLFKEDKLMYITRPTSQFQADPLQALDSVVRNMPGMTYAKVTKGKSQTLTISFPANASYKQISFTFDTQKKRLTRVVYLVKTTLLKPPGGEDDAENKDGEYARVETIFKDYQVLHSKPGWVDEKKYFMRNGNKFTVTEQYKDYKVFIAAPNL